MYSKGVRPFRVLRRRREVIGCDEVRKMLSKLLMALVVEALDCGFLDGPVHSLDLSVGPGVLWFGQPMVDIVSGAGEFESLSTEERAVLRWPF